MKSTRATQFPLYAVVACSLSFLFFGSIAFADSHSGNDAAIITCPSGLQGVSISFTTKYTPPKGWGHADAKGIKSKGGGHADLSPVVIGHGVESRNLICRYGYGSGDHAVRLASIKQTMPKNVACRAEPEFRFHCAPSKN